MKLFLVGLIIALAAGTAVAAYVFRSRRAQGILGFLLQAAYVYIAVILAVGLWRLWQDGF